MKIVHIAPGCSFTESYKYQENLLTHYQSKLGYEVYLLTTTLQRDIDGTMMDVGFEELTLSSGVKLIRCFKLNKLNRITGYFPFTYRYLEKIRPDFIFVHGLCIYAMNYAVKYKKKYPATIIVADNHQDIFNDNHFSFFNKIEQLRFIAHWKKWINYVNKVYGTTSWRVTYAREHYKIPKEKTDELLMGVDVDSMTGKKADIRLEKRQELGIPQNAFVFISGGKINEHKMMVETLREFNKLNESCYFILFGAISDVLLPELDRLIQSNMRILYLGVIDGRSVYQYFYASDFGVFPGRHSVLWEEAIGCGLPCLFRKYEVHDHTDICGNCVRIEKPTQSDIGDVMQKASSSKEWYRSMKRNAEQAKDMLSYYAIAEKSVECLSSEYKDA